MSFLFVIRNFEESEDELRQAVTDSMKNLFVLEDRSSDEAESTEMLAEDDGMKENDDGGASSAADAQQIQLEVEDSRSDAAVRPVDVSSGEGDSKSECLDDTTALKMQHQTS